MQHKVILILLLLLARPCFAATVWYNPVGSNESPYATKATGATSADTAQVQLNAGDTLYYATGTYTSDNDRIDGDIPNGSVGAGYTEVLCETDFECIFSGLSAGTSPVTPDTPVGLYQKSYIKIQGFLFKDTTADNQYASSTISIEESDHIILKNIGVRNGDEYTDVAEYGGSINVGGSNYCLLEDIYASGGMRYGISIVGGSTSHHNIVRRAVVRWGFCLQAQPRAAIVAYGGDQGTTVNNQIIFQNCIVIDGNDGQSSFTGGFSQPHETSNVHRYGCISLKNEGFGFHSAEDSLSNTNTSTHSIVWDSSSGWWWNNLADDSNVSGAYYCTLQGDSGDMGATEFDGPTSGNGVVQIHNCLRVGNASIGSNGIDSTTGTTTAVEGDFTYIVKSPNGGAGATVIYKYGTDGTIWGDAGYNTLTSQKLWPFPNESTIRSLFRESNQPDSGNTPNTNDEDRGFCADSVTLTSYILNYLSPANSIGTTGTIDAVTVQSDVDEYIYGETGRAITGISSTGITLR